jgi:hypothetical protein
MNLLAMRDELRDKNLHDTYPDAGFQGTANDPKLEDTKFLAIRNSDGMYNDTERPKMGCRHMRLARQLVTDVSTKANC